MKRTRHEQWVLIPQDDGNCEKCFFHSNSLENDCNAKVDWRKCTQYVYDEGNKIISQFYRYERILELPINSRTI